MVRQAWCVQLWSVELRFVQVWQARWVKVSSGLVCWGLARFGRRGEMSLGVFC